jgi:hypothetical protein
MIETAEGSPGTRKREAGSGARVGTTRQSLICPTSKAKSFHARHAQIAGRANLPQDFWFTTAVDLENRIRKRDLFTLARN